MSRSSDSAALAEAGRAARAARADRVTAIVLFAFGVAMLAGGFFMERLEIRRIHPASILGPVPMLLVGTLPFVTATALYVGAFVAGFGWPAAPDTRARALLLAKAAALGTLAAWGIATPFSEGFLVRLP